MSCIVEQNWVVRSPNGKIGLIVSLERGKVYYQVKKEDRLFIERSPLGIVTDIMDLSCDLIYNGISTTFINETYQLVAGKKSIYTNCANELILKLQKGDIEFSIDFRVYDDGIGYRYSIPGSGEIKILSEASTFTLPSKGIVNVWAQTFMKCYEYTYNFIAPEDMIQGRYAFPILVQVDTKDWMLITEAAVYGSYCGCHVIGSIDNPRRFNIAFAPDQEGPIIGDKPFVTPWRTVVIGDLSTIVETSLIENLNPPCELDDVSWIKPGRAAWPWFTNKNSCSDLEVNKDYVDFTASMGWEYLLIDAGWQRGLDVPGLVQYAHKKGVGIWLWVHSREMQEEEEVRKKLSQWSKWGVKGIKVDFFDSDSQKTIKQYDMIAKVAAEYKLMVNFHGSTKPSGEQRRWPHILTREGVLGAEYLGGWSDVYINGPTAAHNCTLPFTRNAVGPMDYTPVTFTKNRRVTTYAHQLALAVIFQSHIQHFADSKEAYEECVAKDFLRAVPAVWDDTILLEGYPGMYVTIARRSKDTWFVGSICAGNAREATVPLDFLDDNSIYTATIYWDGLNADVIHLNLTEIHVQTKEVRKGDVIKVPLKINGGCAIMLTKIK